MTKQIKEYAFRQEVEAVGFEIVELDYFFKERTEIGGFNPHKINFYVIIFITDGKGKHSIDFKTYNYKKGSVLFIGKNNIHSWQKSKGVNGYIILYTEKFLLDNQIKFNDISYSYPYNSFLYQPVVNLTNTQIYKTFLSLV